MSVIMTRKVSFFPATHARYVVCFPTILEGEFGPKGLMEEIRTRYYRAYQAWRATADALIAENRNGIGVPFVFPEDNGQVLIFLPLKNDFRDGQINENIIKAVNNLASYLTGAISLESSDRRHQVTMPPILLEQAEGESRKDATLRSIRWLRRKLDDVETTIEVSVSPWRMMRKPEDAPLYYLTKAGNYHWEDNKNFLPIPENPEGTMERTFITCDTDWSCDVTLRDLHIEPHELQFYREYRPSDTEFVLSLCVNADRFEKDGTARRLA